MRTQRKDISHTHLPVHVKFHLNTLSLGFKRINSLGPFNLHNQFLHGQLFLYLFLSTFGNLSVDFLLPCICLLASVFSSWAALHNGSWARAACGECCPGGCLGWAGCAQHRAITATLWAPLSVLITVVPMAAPLGAEAGETSGCGWLPNY